LIIKIYLNHFFLLNTYYLFQNLNNFPHLHLQLTKITTSRQADPAYVPADRIVKIEAKKGEMRQLLDTLGEEDGLLEGEDGKKRYGPMEAKVWNKAMMEEVMAA
jgi:hypothetical protein